MRTVGVRELGRNTSAVLRRVAAGEIVVVTKRRKAVARIVPARDTYKLEQLQTEGRASSATGDLLDVKPIRRIAGRPSLSRILADMRTDGSGGRCP